MGIYKNNAKQELVALLNNLQKKEIKSIIIEDRVDSIIENIIRETIQRINVSSSINHRRIK